MDMPYTPEALIAAVALIRKTCLQESVSWARDVQSAMRSGAPWTDRNGPSMTGLNARQSLEAEAGTVDNGDIMIVARSTRQTLKPWRGWDGAPVGAFLELSTRFMSQRPIIKVTVERMAPQLITSLNSSFGSGI
jgi:hypothetical protein